MTIARSLVAATLFSTSSLALAASDSATSDITLTIPTAIEIAQLDNVALNATAGSDATADEPFCVGGTGFATYSIQFDSSAGSGDFQLSDGGSTTVPYSVEFENDIAGTGFATTTEGVADGGHARNTASCSGTDNAQIRVTVAQADWEALNGTSYTDTLTVVVTSE